MVFNYFHVVKQCPFFSQSLGTGIACIMEKQKLGKPEARFAGLAAIVINSMH
jgi:hypothetical protein